VKLRKYLLRTIQFLDGRLAQFARNLDVSPPWPAATFPANFV
jgi:hypothetical protein